MVACTWSIETAGLPAERSRQPCDEHALGDDMRLTAVRGQAHQEEAPQMSKWNFVAMGQVGLTGWTREVAKPVARSIARRTGRPEAEILSLIGAAFLAVTLITREAR